MNWIYYDHSFDFLSQKCIVSFVSFDFLNIFSIVFPSTRVAWSKLFDFGCNKLTIILGLTNSCAVGNIDHLSKINETTKNNFEKFTFSCTVFFSFSSVK